MRLALSTLALALLVAPAHAGGELARVERIALDQVAARGFTLDRDQEVEIGGVRLRPSANRELMAAWILDASSRRVAWQLDHAAEYRVRTSTAHFKTTARLGAGSYELYVATFPGAPEPTGFWAWVWSFLSLRGVDAEGQVDQVEVWVKGEGRGEGAVTAQSVRSRLAAGAVVALTCVGDSATLRQGLLVTAPLEVEVRALGELGRGEPYDVATIVDAATRRPVWALTHEGSEPAGGAAKNREARATVRLAPGRYLATVTTDSSHSCPRFNSTPPHDPFAWGLVVRPLGPGPTAVATFDYSDPLEHAVVAAVTGLGDDARGAAGFELRQPLEVLVHAVGEGKGGQMFDYGWIVAADTGEPVWSMTWASSSSAGGGSKNRLVEAVVPLAPGRYVVHFVTDGSHSPAGWNDAPPAEPGRWGVTVAAASGSLPAGVVVPFDPARETAALARIHRVGNNANGRQELRLAARTTVRVVALGEGSGGEMFDRGWITDSSGATVWEMRYPATEHAGGADKNRVARATLTLAPGTYELRYATDGSHAWGRWNDAPPYDPDAWGIAVYPAAPATTTVEDPRSGR